MTTVREHYDNLLADVYDWMTGDREEVFRRHAAFFAACRITPQTTGFAIDLGAGSGFQTVPLARAGFSVLAVDSSSKLLQELKRASADLDVRAVEADLLEFSHYCDTAPELIVCMGDTLTHLEYFADVAGLIDKAAGHLAARGKLILSFRDYVFSELQRGGHFIPVRSDADRIFTCFLQYEAETVRVHDMLYQRRDDEWEFNVSSYRKLRLNPHWIKEKLGRAGLQIVFEEQSSGMIYLIAQKI